MPPPEPVRRPPEIEELTNRLVIHPLANRLTFWLRDRGITPNTVSLTGMACGIAAGLAYHRSQTWPWALAGFLLMLAWHVMDGADGQLARLTNTQSPTGRILDGVCDYVTFIAVYIGLATLLSHHHGGRVWILVALSGLAHAVQSAAYEAQRQEYEYWGYGRQAKSILAPAPRLLDRLYAAIQTAAIGPTLAFHRQLAAGPPFDPAMRQRYRDMFAPQVRQWSILSSNTRTMALFACATLHRPLWYFLAELIALSLTLAWLTYRQKRVHGAFLAIRASSETTPPPGPSASGRVPVR